MSDSSLLIGAKGEEGLIQLIKLIRFDDVKHVLFTKSKIENGKFSTTYDGKSYTFTKTRKVSIRNKEYTYSTEVYYSPELDIYFMNVARIVTYLKDSAFNFLQRNINGHYGAFYIDRIEGRKRLVKVLVE